MKQDHPRTRATHSVLEAAQQRIRVLEDQLTRQKEIAKGLRGAHAFREGVIERAAEGVCVCHDIPTFPFVKFTVWNRRMTEITGYTMKEINRKGWYQSVYPNPEVQARARERMNRMRKGDDLRFERWEITRADGEKRLTAISTSILTTKGGATHVLALLHDFTGEECAQRLARIDDLTQVKNRRGFKEDAGLLLKLAARKGQPITFTYLDVDGLKVVNDSFGHEEGDKVLKVLASTLLNSVRSTDVVGRVGGDEFALAFLGMGPPDTKLWVSHTHQQLLREMRERGWGTGVSMGVVSFSGSVPDLEKALARADFLMYQAKKKGNGGLLFEEISDQAKPPKVRKI